MFKSVLCNYKSVMYLQQCRLERQAFGPVFSLELFAHAGRLYVSHGTSPSVSDLTELLQLCGGRIVNNVDCLLYTSRCV